MRGIVWGGPTNNPPRAYLAALRKAFPEIAKDYLGFAFDYAYYDAMTATLQALDRVHGDLSGGERRFMAALARVTLMRRTATRPSTRATGRSRPTPCSRP